MKRAPRNTEHDIAEHPWSFLAESIRVGTSEPIERQEARGQREFIVSTTLPTDMSEQARMALESWGIKFLGAIPGDPLFQYVELPRGWKRKPTDNAMHSELVDDAGTTRAQIFYKAAFYDRRASLDLVMVKKA